MKESYYNKHKSIIIIFVLILLSLAFLTIGVILNEKTDKYSTIFSIILIQLSGTSLSACIGIIVFSISDLKDYISKTIATLFLTGDLIQLVSKHTQKTLDKRLLLNNLPNINSIENIDNSLYNDLNLIKEGNLNNFYLYNYNQEILVKDSKKHHGYAEVTRIISYRVKAGHLSEIKFPFKITSRYFLNSNDNLNLKDNFEFEARIGSHVISKESLQYENSDNAFSFKYQNDFDIKEDFDVYIRDKGISLLDDNVFFFFTRFPTNGYNITLRYRDDKIYDCMWYINWKKMEVSFPNVGIRENLDDGLKVITNNWVLPGEGLVVYHLPKK